MQIVQPDIGVVVISSVTEGIIIGIEVGSVAVAPGNRLVSPSVVGVINHQISHGVVYGDNIPLQILLKVEGIESILGVCRIPILHPDGGTTFVVEVDQKIVAPSLGDNAATFQCVDMIHAVHGLSRAEAVGVVGEKACPFRAFPAAEAAGYLITTLSFFNHSCSADSICQLFFVKQHENQINNHNDADAFN